MRFKKFILAALAAIFMVSLTACSKDIKGVTTEIYTTARRDKITLTAKFTDTESRIFSSVTPTAHLYDIKDGKQGDEIESQTLQNAGDSNNVGKETTSKSVTFSGLEKSTEEKAKEYKIVVKASFEGYSNTLIEKTVKMGNEGADEEHAIPVKTAKEFLEIQYDREGYFKLENDIDFAELKGDAEVYKLSPMFTNASNSFKGQIDGNNHKISNFLIESNNQYNGLVGYNAGKIINLTIENAKITSKRTSELNTGLIAGYNTGAIKNCVVNNSEILVTSSAYSLTYPLVVGGLVGTVSNDNSNIEVSNCKTNNLKLTVDAVHRATVGGMIGQILAPDSVRMGQIIENNTITGMALVVNQENKTKTTDDILVYVGGFVGSTARTVKNSHVVDSTIAVTGKLYEGAKDDKLEDRSKVYNAFVGGFAGLTSANSRGIEIDSVSFKGTAEGKSKISASLPEAYKAYVGGLIGSMDGIRIENSKVEAVEFTLAFHEEAAATAEAPAEAITYSAGYGYIVGGMPEGVLPAANPNSHTGCKLVDLTKLGIALENSWK